MKSFTAINIGDTGAELVTALKDNYTIISNNHLGEYNIIDYGAVSNDGTTANEVAIQSAITAALAHYGIYGYYGKVIIPPGKYYITSHIELKSNISIEIAKNAIFHFPDNYADSIWYAPAGTSLVYCYVNGGVYGGLTNNNSWRLVDLNASNGLTSYVMFCGFYNMRAINCDIGIKSLITNDGWITGIQYSNILISNPKIGVKCEQPNLSTNVMADCLFEKFDIQCGPATTNGFVFDGNSCVFSNIFIYDVVGNAITLSNKTSKNSFIGGAIGPLLNNIIDDGYYNKILSNDDTRISSSATRIPLIDAGVGISENQLNGLILLELTVDIDIIADPQIGKGIDGQVIVIANGVNTGKLTLDNGDGLMLSSQCVLDAGDTIMLQYSQTSDKWYEIARSNN
jgi:hypothetical protein